MAHTTLRTLTAKSRIGYGKYADCTVQELLDSRQYKDLAWIYYHVEYITFMPDILEQISIRPEERITKPGIDHDMHERRLRGIRMYKYKDNYAVVNYQKRKKAARKRAQRWEDSIDYSPAALQAINHGHRRR